MGQAAGPAAAGMSMANVGLQMYSSYLSSRAAKAEDVFKAQQLEEQATIGRLKADQVNAQKTRNLAITLSHVDAVRAAAHTDPTSPTGAAVRGTMEEAGTEAKNITVENILQQSRMDEANAAYLRSAGSNALLAGDIDMVSKLLAGGAGALQSMPGGGTPDLSQPLPGSAPLGQGGIGSA
jgi:hypothetical protein